MQALAVRFKQCVGFPAKSFLYVGNDIRAHFVMVGANRGADGGQQIFGLRTVTLLHGLDSHPRCAAHRS